jgi:hypothetical protein
MVAHQQYSMLDLGELKALLRTPIVIDGRRMLDKGAAEAAGLRHRGVGQAG